MWFRENACNINQRDNKLVIGVDLTHFHSSLLGNEEDVKGLLNIKQEVFQELSLSAPEIVTPQLPEDLFASTLIPSDFADTGKPGKVVECRI